jgi:hypothetical protein
MGASSPIRRVFEDFDDDEDEHATAIVATTTSAVIAERTATLDFM